MADNRGASGVAQRTATPDATCRVSGIRCRIFAQPDSMHETIDDRHFTRCGPRTGPLTQELGTAGDSLGVVAVTKDVANARALGATNDRAAVSDARS